MEEQQKSIDEIFRQSLGDYREAPPAAAWDKVAGRLDDDEGKRRGIFLRWPWISLLLLLLAGGGWFIAAQYGGGGAAEQAHSTAPIAANSGAGATAPHDTAQDTSSGKPADTAGKAASAVAPDNADNPVKQANQKKPAGSRSAAGSRHAAAISQGTVHHAGAQSHHTAGPGRQSGAPQQKVVAIKEQDAVGSNAGSTGTKQPSSPKPASHAKTARKRPSASMVTVEPTAKKNGDQRPASSRETPQDTTAPAEARPGRLTSTGATKSSKKHSASNARAHRNPSADKVAATTNGSAAPAKSEAADSLSPQKKNPEEGRHKSRTKSANNQYAAALAATRSAAAAKASAVKKQPSDQATAAKKKALQTQQTTAAVQQTKLQNGIKNTSKKRPGLQPANGKPVKVGATASKSRKPAASAEIAEKNPSKRQNLDTADKAANRRPLRQDTASAAKKSPAAEKPVVADSKPQQANPAAKPLREPEVGKWHPTETPAPPASTANASKEDGKTADENNTSDGGGGGGGGGAAAPASARKKTSFSLTALAGYEFGLEKPAPNNVTGAFRLLWHFDPGIAIGIQPAFRYGNVSSTVLTSPATYQRTSAVKVDSVIAFDSTGFKVIDRRYYLSGTFDSIVVAGLSVGGTMWQIELPIVLSYKIAKAWHVYGGPSINLGGKINSSSAGSLQTYTVSRVDSVKSSGGTVQSPKPISSFQGYFNSSSLPEFSTYSPTTNTLQDPASLRFGYIVGLGYERKRIIFDASLHQQISGYSDVAKPLQKVYSSPNVRFSIGYILFPQKNVRRNTAE